MFQMRAGVLDDNLNVASSSTSVSSSTCGSSYLQKGQHYANVVITSTMDLLTSVQPLAVD